MNSLEKEFIPYELALEMKQIGFDEPCIARFIGKQFSTNTLGNFYKHNSGEISNKFISAPTFSQCFKFFRDNFQDLDFGIGKIHNGTNNYHYHINLKWEFFEGSYEEAEQECLKQLIKIVNK